MSLRASLTVPASTIESRGTATTGTAQASHQPPTDADLPFSPSTTHREDLQLLATSRSQSPEPRVLSKRQLTGAELEALQGVPAVAGGVSAQQGGGVFTGGQIYPAAASTAQGQAMQATAPSRVAVQQLYEAGEQEHVHSHDLLFHTSPGPNGCDAIIRRLNSKGRMVLCDISCD
jgi:hypothetical protein